MHSSFAELSCGLFGSVVKAVPLHARTDTEGSRKLRLPDYVTMAHNWSNMCSRILEEQNK